MMADLDKHPEEGRWCDWRSISRERLAVATDTQLAAELRKPTTHKTDIREATVGEAMARILERKP